MNLIGLVDCTSFYCSCERAFRPDLINRPIVVLSNNDGCVISRSPEAKELGVPMGAPFHKIKQACVRQGIVVFSSNYNLYADMSRRIGIVLERFSEIVERYSIDESFIGITLPDTTFSREVVEEYACTIRRAILKATGIPVRVSFAETKTLAKVASELAKDYLKQNLPPCICLINHPDREMFLGSLSVGDVWGVGRKLTQHLEKYGIFSAGDLARANPVHMKKLKSIELMATSLELKGSISFPLTASPQPPKSIIRSRMFARRLTNPSIISQAISAHLVRGVEKARFYNRNIQYLTVWAATGRFETPAKKYVSHTIKLDRPTSDVFTLNNLALDMWNSIYVQYHEDGITLVRYARAGITLSGLIDAAHCTNGLFDDIPGYKYDSNAMLKRRRAIEAIDRVNSLYGTFSMVFASMGTPKKLHAMMEGAPHAVEWAMKRQHMSPRYTTQWKEIMRVKC